MTTIRWAPAGTTDWVDLTPYVRDVQAVPADPDDQTIRDVAVHTQLSEQEARIILEAAAEAGERWANGPCRCRSLPWTPHKHRYEMTRRGLR